MTEPHDTLDFENLSARSVRRWARSRDFDREIAEALEVAGDPDDLCDIIYRYRVYVSCRSESYKRLVACAVKGRTRPRPESARVSILPNGELAVFLNAPKVSNFYDRTLSVMLFHRLGLTPAKIRFASGGAATHGIVAPDKLPVLYSLAALSGNEIDGIAT